MKRTLRKARLVPALFLAVLLGSGGAPAVGATLGTVCRVGNVGCSVPAQPIGTRCFCGSQAGTIVG